MPYRVSLWIALFAFGAMGMLRAQSPAAVGATAAMQPGQIIAKQVTGSVTMVLNGTTTALHNSDPVSQAATIISQSESSVILVFSNGATTQLGSDTTLVIEEFMQDPFAETVVVANLTAEPTRSHTKLNLTKGELLGKVAKLKHEDGSYFTVQTPVGAAGIRGTTFRIVFRPTGTGQAFAVFSLSTLEGNVNFQQGAAGEPGATQAAPGGQQGGSPAPQSPETPPKPGAPAAPSGEGPAGVPVTTGQEVVVTVSVNVNQQTGSIAVAPPPVVTATQPISIETQALLVQQAQTLATTAAGTSFTPSAPSSPAGNNAAPANQQAEKPDEAQAQDQQGSTTGGAAGDGASAGGGAGGGSDGSSPGPQPGSTGSTNSSQSNPSGAQKSSGNSTGGNPPPPPPPPPTSGFGGLPSPGVTTSAPNLTPGAGKGPQ